DNEHYVKSANGLSHVLHMTVLAILSLSWSRSLHESARISITRGNSVSVTTWAIMEVFRSGNVTS
ncbi:MAG: hypothetical protein OR995_07535, partial [Candidatus Nanopelagicales bacterium]|nr:hypothetical protein [Candidatus Nanopelagicales bacterium]